MHRTVAERLHLPAQHIRESAEERVAIRRQEGWHAARTADIAVSVSASGFGAVIGRISSLRAPSSGAMMRSSSPCVSSAYYLGAPGAPPRRGLFARSLDGRDPFGAGPGENRSRSVSGSPTVPSGTLPTLREWATAHLAEMVKSSQRASAALASAVGGISFSRKYFSKQISRGPGAATDGQSVAFDPPPSAPFFGRISSAGGG